MKEGRKKGEKRIKRQERKKEIKQGRKRMKKEEREQNRRGWRMKGGSM